MNQSILSAALPAMSNGRRWLRQPVSRGHWRRWRRILTGAYLLAAVASLFVYIPFPSASSILGGLALLYTPVFEKHPPERFRFGWPALFFIALFLILPERTTLYPALCCAACLLLETFYRRIVATVPIILGLLFPITTSFIDKFSYPIRLQLVRLAGRIATSASRSATDGPIPFHDRALSIDHPGEGLHLLLISWLAALLLMNYYQRHNRRKLPAAPMLLLLATATAFCLIANLFRIICFALLAIVPANPLHHVLGLFSFLAFIFLPLLLVTRWTVRRWRIPPLQDNSRPARNRGILLSNIVVAAAILLLAAFHWVKIW